MEHIIQTHNGFVMTDHDKKILFIDNLGKSFLLDEQLILTEYNFEKLSEDFILQDEIYVYEKSSVFLSSPDPDELLHNLLNRRLHYSKKIRWFIDDFFMGIINKDGLEILEYKNDHCIFCSDREEGCCITDCFDIDFFPTLKHYSFQKLSKFDYRKKNRFVFLDCKIKKVSKPKIKDGQYIQKITCYDDNTNFELEAVLPENFADFDKWKKNDNTRLIGYYNEEGRCVVCYISKMNPTVIVPPDDIDDDVKLSRSQEVDGYDEWRNTILEKDDHKCVCCGLDKHLHVHHLFGYAEHPELAVDENNGVTLCKFCHDRYHSIYGVKNINPRDFIEYISKYGV